MDWSTFWTAVAAIAQIGAAGATVWVVIVALRQGKKGSEQFLQARYDEARPILIVVSDASHIETQKDHETWLDWSAQHQAVKVANVGKGIALHVRSVIYGPEAVLVPDVSQQSIPDTTSSNTHWYYWKSDVIRPGEEKVLVHDLGASIFETKNKHIENYSFNAPPQPLPRPSGQQKPTCICRLSLTYHDIFRRKHASIYDLVLYSGWQEVDDLEAIPYDLFDLERY